MWLQTSERLIQKAAVKSADDVRRFARELVQHSPERRKLNLELRRYLYKNLYYNPTSSTSRNRRAVKMLGELFKYCLAHPKEIGDSARKRIRQTGLHRAVCDYLAGMTDRYVMRECRTPLRREIQSSS